MVTMRSLPAGTLILVLEDEPLIRMDIEAMLQDSGFNVILLLVSGLLDCFNSVYFHFLVTA